MENVIAWLIAHADDIIICWWIADQIAAATPESLKIGSFEIGKYDNIAVSFLKNLGKKFVDRFVKK